MISAALIPVQTQGVVRVYRLGRRARRNSPLLLIQRFLRRRNAR
jgi:hypothetical protein